MGKRILSQNTNNSEVPFQYMQLPFQLRLGFATSVKVAGVDLQTNCVLQLEVQEK